MKTVAIIAPTGMLGSMLYKELKEKYRLVLVYRNKDKLEKLNEIYGDVEKHIVVKFDLNDIYKDYYQGFKISVHGKNTQKLIAMIGDVDTVINCAGIIKENCFLNPTMTFFINGSIPHILSSIYQDKLIHITTDCVFNGLKGAPYNEDAIKTPNDLYGLSKSIGEPRDHSLVLRTSFIGPEITDFISLISWLKQQENKTVEGYTNHWWNGITTKQCAKVCSQVIDNRTSFPKQGLFHIFSSDISKYEMLNKLKDKYKIKVDVIATEANPVDRRLSSVHNFCTKLNIPEFDSMLSEL